MNGRFTFWDRGGSLSVELDSRPFLAGISPVFHSHRAESVRLTVARIAEAGEGVAVDFENGDALRRFRLIFAQRDGVLLMRIDAQTDARRTDGRSYFAAADAVTLPLRFEPRVDETYSLGIRERVWWQKPAFGQTPDALRPGTQDLHIRSGANHVHLLPLVDDSFRSEWRGNALTLSPGCGAVSRMEGAFLAVAVSGDPYRAIRENFAFARETGAISVPLRSERAYPAALEGLGYCTWDAFHEQVTADKIFGKLDEFAQKGIRIDYLLIDDGWLDVNGKMLRGFHADPRKFPGGLGAAIRVIKEKYAVGYVGVWQAIGGYWDGVDPDGEIAKALPDSLLASPNGQLIPHPDAERGFAFWDAWHGILAEQGVDFVKVDNQSFCSFTVDEVMLNTKAVRMTHEALERSARKHFGGAILNCMGMNMQDVLTRPYSAVNRNSCDYVPGEPESFLDHIYYNLYSAPMHGMIHFCDFDMWWSGNSTALASAVLRAVSGGPVYMSDAQGETNPGLIRPLYNAGGRIIRCDAAAMPTYDCLYRDCRAEYLPLKVFNHAGQNFVVAAFGLSEKRVSGSLRLSDIPGAEGTYLAQDFFTKEYRRLGREDEIRFSLNLYEVALWNLYPLKDGAAAVGDPDAYVGAAGTLQPYMG